MSGDLRTLVRREILARRQQLTGTVISPMILIDLDATGAAPTWVATVDIGSGRPIKNVPIKSVNGTRQYAQLGLPVALRRNAQGRYVIDGPADHAVANRFIKTYTVGLNTALTTDQLGYSFNAVDFFYYQGLRNGGVGPDSIWDDGVTDFPLTVVIDQDGNPI